MSSQNDKSQSESDSESKSKSKPNSSSKSKSSSSSKRATSPVQSAASPSPSPSPQATIPFGLEYLTTLDQLMVHQEVQMLEVLTNWQTNNRYNIVNARQQNVFFAVEVNDFFTTNFMGSSRPFEMLIVDTLGRNVLRIHRPFRVSGFSCMGVVQEIEVFSALGQLLGTISEEFRCCAPLFRVTNAIGQTVFWIEGPLCQFSFLDTDFNILAADKSSTVGRITRHFPGFFKQMYSKADMFGVHFPIDLAVEMKAVLLAATFIIDFMYYENHPSSRQQQNNYNNNYHGGGFGGHNQFNQPFRHF